MSNQTLNLTDPLYQYLLGVSIKETEELAALREETKKHAMAVMQVSPEQGQFMNFMLKLICANRGIEIGVFTGYSTLWSAYALPDDGEIIACDISDEYTSIARPFWEKSGMSNKIHLHLGEADKTLDRLIEQGQENSFDYAFIDADKVRYKKYVQQCLQLVKPSGIILIDNTLWGGKVADESIKDADTLALRELNEWLYLNPNIELSLLPIGDGLTLLKKKL